DEYVARVLRIALDELAWTEDPTALKLIFVAGNEPATQDPTLDVRAVSRAAIQKGVIVNPIYCGNPADADAAGWRDVATSADAQFAAIDHGQATMVVATPFDDRLAALSASLTKTYLPYGDRGATCGANQIVQDHNAAGLNSQAAAQRAACKAGALYVNSAWDLV